MTVEGAGLSGAEDPHDAISDTGSPIVVVIDEALTGSAGDGEAFEALGAEVAAAISDAMTRLGVEEGAGVGVMLTDDETLRRLNRDHRGRDATTDVLSFPSDVESDESEWIPEDVTSAGYLGDIAISVPEAARGADDAGHSLIDEVRLLAVHGLLHLLGHDDATDDGADEMERLERELGVRGEAD